MNAVGKRTTVELEDQQFHVFERQFQSVTLRLSMAEESQTLLISIYGGSFRKPRIQHEFMKMGSVWHCV